uniref:Conserved domain protein n=1 Tax=Heterorhabditis bacteriophora TaxID=37862 RepID=A0A1I7X7W4_HETBA
MKRIVNKSFVTNMTMYEIRNAKYPLNASYNNSHVPQNN